MANFRAWVEETRAGNFQVRFRDGKTKTDKGRWKVFPYICVERTERAVIDGKLYVGKTLANQHRDKCQEKYHLRKLEVYDSNELTEPLAEQYFEELENREYSPRSIAHDRASVMALIHENKFQTIKEVTREGLEAWIGRMRRAGYANGTIRGRLADSRCFFNWLLSIKKIEQTPFGRKLLPQAKPVEPKYYTGPEYTALDDAMAKIRPMSRLACALAHSAGLRKAEIVGHSGDPVTSPRVMMEDITWLDNGRAELLIRRETTKTKRSRTVPLDAGILALIGSRRPGPICPYSRYDLENDFKKAKILAGINPKLTFHGLRHTFAKNYLQRGEGNLASLSKLMGHASIMSTMIYAQFEKSYYHEGIERAYERRIVEENLAGQLVNEISLAGQIAGKNSNVGERS